MRTPRGIHRSLRVFWVVGLVVPWLAERGFGQDDQGLVPRTPWPKEPLVFVPVPQGTEFELIIKFNDDARVRVTEGGLISESGEDLTGVIADADFYGVSFAQAIDLPADEIEAFEEDAETRSGREVADLQGIMNVLFPPGTTQDELVNIGNDLQDEAPVEYVRLAALLPLPCEDPPDPTPPHVDLQTYRGATVGGMDFDYAWSTGAGKGAGIRVTDVERSLLREHEDLCDLPAFLPTVQPMIAGGTYELSSDNQDRNHGTATAGVLFARENDYGMSGVVPDCDFFFSPISVVDVATDSSVPRRKTAIVEALKESEPGDIVLIEIQEGLDSDSYKAAPADVLHYEEIECGVHRDVIVVLAAGNGAWQPGTPAEGADLDSAPYSEYRMHLMKSGAQAIAVGGGTADMTHAKKDYSTYGNRVDVQAWGEDVATLGGFGGAAFDHAAMAGDKSQRYTTSFNGTSSAAALVAGACASIQSYAVDRLCRRLTLSEMRTLLTSTGIPQGGPMAGAKPIGPFVDVRGAIEGLRSSHLSACRFRRGDCNGDDTVNISDAGMVFCRLFSTCPKPPCLEACDANDSGTFDIADACFLLEYLFNGRTPPPAPGPTACGPDPLGSVDNLGCEIPLCE